MALAATRRARATACHAACPATGPQIDVRAADEFEIDSDDLYRLIRFTNVILSLNGLFPEK